MVAFPAVIINVRTQEIGCVPPVTNAFQMVAMLSQGIGNAEGVKQF